MDPTDQFDKSTNPEFTFINLSHPDDLKNQDTIDQIRCSAMTNFGRLRRKRKPKRESNQIVFEVRPPGSVMTDPVALSRVGLESLSPFESAPYDMNPEASRLCASSESTFSLDCYPIDPDCYRDMAQLSADDTCIPRSYAPPYSPISHAADGFQFSALIVDTQQKSAKRGRQWGSKMSSPTKQCYLTLRYTVRCFAADSCLPRILRRACSFTIRLCR